MTKARKTRDKKHSPPGNDHGFLEVVNSQGVRRRFLRGIVTHDLMQRGLDFDHAYAIARSIRDQLAGRDEVTTSEIRDLIQQRLEETFGPDLPPQLRKPPSVLPELTVVQDGNRQPFSRGLLAHSIRSAGLDLDRAYSLVLQLQAELQQDAVAECSNQEIARRVADLLERSEGSATAHRYRLIRSINRLPRPLIVYIGGASGTGKSTLSLELAPLLRIRRINSTDTVRQLMRMVFSQQILPNLHSSSFELTSTGAGRVEALGSSSSELHRQIIAGFEEQATRVCVGVRAVVERAIVENMSILIEGTHLIPPLIPFLDLEGSAYQIALVLACVDAEAHRSRFLSRGRLSGRQAERYLENFGAIRAIHDHILHQAELHDLSLLETSSGDVPAIRALRLITGLLQQKIPDLVQPEVIPPDLAPTLLLIVDGLGDRPVRALGARTPLQAARTPTLNRLAREGQTGLADPVAPGVVPDTASGTLAILGQSPLSMKRGPLECLGAGLEMAADDVALRANFVTLDAKGLILDRRAGRIREGAEQLAQALDRLPLPSPLGAEIQIRVRSTTEHRLAILLQGEGLSSAVQGSDPGEGAGRVAPLTPRPTDPTNPNAVRTARALSIFEQQARPILERHPVNKKRLQKGLPPANALVMRGAGRLHRLMSLEHFGHPLKIACISGDRTVLGLADWLGGRVISSSSMTANLDTNLRRKFALAEEALDGSDLVILHVKGADIASHDRRPDLKVRFLEKLDRQIGNLLRRHKGPLRIVVTSDHSTLSESGQHGADPLPILIWGAGIEKDSSTAFNEQAVVAGSLGRFPMQLLMTRLFELS